MKKNILLLTFFVFLASNVYADADIKAKRVRASTTNFNGNLSAADNTVQKALDTLDDVVGGGGGGDNVTVNGSAATNANLEDTARVKFTLDTTPAPDDINADVHLSATDKILGRFSASGGSAEEATFNDAAQDHAQETWADDQLWVADSASAGTPRTLPDSDGASQKLQYDQATNSFSAGTDDDVPDAGDFGNATDLDNNGAVKDNAVDGSDIAVASEAAGDILYHDGTDWVRLPKGTAGQVLEMNAGATAPEWDTDDSGGGGGSAINSVCDFRLTTETGVPISTSDRTSQGTIYFTPYIGNTCYTYDSSTWTAHTFTEISLALSSLTSDKNYDVFLYSNSGTMTLELSAAWTNDTTRADALTRQDGVLVKSGTASRRYVATIRTTGTASTEDSAAKRFVWNMQNRVPRLLSVSDLTDHTYNTGTWRQYRAQTSNQLDFVIGEAMAVSAFVLNDDDGGYAIAGIGCDATTQTAPFYGYSAASQDSSATPRACSFSAGRHYMAVIQIGDGSSSTFYDMAITGTFWG